jgi:hypothetical protein
MAGAGLLTQHKGNGKRYIVRSEKVLERIFGVGSDAVVMVWCPMRQAVARF